MPSTDNVTEKSSASVGRRIAFYLPALAAGGMERVTLLLAESLAARGFAVDIVLEKAIGNYLDRIPNGVRLVVLESNAKFPAYAQLVRAWPREGLMQCARLLSRSCEYIPIRRLVSLANYMRENRPRVVFCSYGRIPILALWARAIAGEASVSIAIIEHSTYSRRIATFRDDPVEYRKLRYGLALMRRMYPYADALVGVSDGVAADLAEIVGVPRNRVATIYNPVVTKQMSELATARPSHPWLANKQEPVILAVGRLAPEKGFSILLDAVAKLKTDGSSPRLLLLGEGPERQALVEHAKAINVYDALDMPGWVDNPYAYMSNADIVVLSSFFEGLPIVLIEALACGCPVVATDCRSGPREILEQGALGPLVPTGDAAALAAAIADVLRRPPDRARLRCRGYYFSVDRAADAYSDLVDGLGNDV